MKVNRGTPVRGNVLNKDKFQPRMAEILDYVSEAVSETLGPYGHNALIQMSDRVISTKDGWTVLQNITFDNVVDNSMKSLIETVAHSVVLRVGDGSTSATLLANRLLKYLSTNDIVVGSPNQEVERALIDCVDILETCLRKNAVQVTDENMADIIYKVAMVSSNWNEELSALIRDIYVTTKNPIIKVQNSGTDRTVVEYIEGYDLSGRLVLNQYINNVDEAKCEVENPRIMMFTYGLTSKYVIPLMLVGSILSKNKTPFIVMAPSFDKAFTDQLMSINLKQVREQKGMVNLIPVIYDNKFNIDKECVEDFAVLVNTILVTDDDDNIKEFFDDVTKHMLPNRQEDQDENGELSAEEKVLFMQTALEFMDSYCGTCGKATINDKGILVNGFDKNEFVENLIAERKKAIEAEVVAKTKECDALTMLTDDIRMKRIRLGKLQCNMGIIKVGGFGDADLRAKKDSLEDTIRACEAAYRDGVIVGSGLAGLIYGETDKELSTLQKIVVAYITHALTDIFARIILNKYQMGIVSIKDTTRNDVMYHQFKVGDIIDKCISEKIGFDIKENQFDMEFKIINPVNVDIEILRGSLKLVITALTSNQFLYRNYDGLNYLSDDDLPDVDEFINDRASKNVQTIDIVKTVRTDSV